MIASGQVYPPFLEHLQTSGWLLKLLLVLLFAAFTFGLFHLSRGFRYSTASVLLIFTPTLIGCGLAAFQAYLAEGVVWRNEFGLTHNSLPERYIGYVRIFLGIGICMSLILLAVAHFSRSHPNDRNA